MFQQASPAYTHRSCQTLGVTGVGVPFCRHRLVFPSGAGRRHYPHVPWVNVSATSKCLSPFLGLLGVVLALLGGCAATGAVVGAVACRSCQTLGTNAPSSNSGLNFRSHHH
jgi:hypothetical protein